MSKFDKLCLLTTLSSMGNKFSRSTFLGCLWFVQQATGNPTKAKRELKRVQRDMSRLHKNQHFPIPILPGIENHLKIIYIYITVTSIYLFIYLINRGYYMGARRYEFYFRVLILSLASERSERAQRTSKR
jgi:hypothetical protein